VEAAVIGRRALVAAALGCSGKTTQAGGLEIVVSTDMATPASFDVIHVDIEQEGEGGTWVQPPLLDQYYPLGLAAGETALPTTLSLAAGTGPYQEVLVTVTGLQGGPSGVAVVERVVETQVPTDRLAELPIVLAAVCAGKLQCPSGDSCQPVAVGSVSAGSCGTDVVGIDSLPPYMPSDVLDAGVATIAAEGGPGAGNDSAVDAGGDATTGGKDAETAEAGGDSSAETGETREAGSDSEAGGPPLSSVATVSVGETSACALFPGGTVKCWGDNEFGQLGDGTTTISPMPVTVAGLTGATAVSVGNSFACALLAGGAVRCWGFNDKGQLGNGTSDASVSSFSSTPVAVSGISGATAISTGEEFACAVIAGGTVECWGDNRLGELGNAIVDASATPFSSTPVAIQGLSGATAVAAGVYAACAVLSGGTVECWGYNGSGQLGNPGVTANSSATPVAVSGLTGVTALSLGIESEFACALLSGGSIECWGDNEYGQLGDGTTNGSATPVAVSGVAGATAVAAGDYFACALSSGGTAQCWGYDYLGELGNNATVTYDPTPVAVSGIANATSISAGASTCVVSLGGTVHCWGSNEDGQLGDGSEGVSSTPVAVAGLGGAGAVAVSYSTACALSGGGVKCWGADYGAELDGGAAVVSLTPAAVSGLSGATALAMGGNFACAVVSGGSVQCWGYNSAGALGDGTTNNSALPVAVSGLTGATALSAGYNFACALVADGSVQCWGANGSGQLGNGMTTSSSTPVAVSGLVSATEISAGYGSACALSGGTVRCWGTNDYGELGNGTMTPSHVPVAVDGLSGAIGVSAGGQEACAVLSGGAVQCWGADYNGQLGNGSTAVTGNCYGDLCSTTPVAVSGITSATAVSVGSNFACAVLSGGTVECWGDNEYGELGDGTTTSSATPVAVHGLTGAIAVSVGEESACALLSGGGVQCWGDNLFGELGDGTLGYSPTPVAVQQ
jgi:alpha-tubulin suppressor-like RCC1 family protein